MVAEKNNITEGKSVKLFMAPMEGITGYIFRNIFDKHFGTGVYRYYTPFLALCQKNGITDKDVRDILPENNRVVRLVPQVMTVSAEDFFKAKQRLRDIGYEEINLNFGCPSRTVTSKGRGAGALADMDSLERFLDEVYQDGDRNISIKTRIGIENETEFAAIMQIYNKYPVKELTIHPRLLNEKYLGIPHRDIFLEALQTARMPVCYNGDINSVEDYLDLMKAVRENSSTNISGVMIGRGLLRDPALIRKIDALKKSSASTIEEKYGASDKEIYLFLNELQSEYTRSFSGDIPVLYKMKEIWAHLGNGIYSGNKKLIKKLMKCRSLRDYEVYIRQIFNSEILPTQP